MNGNHIFLSAYDHGQGGVFDLGLNLSQLTKVEMVDDTTVKLTVTWDDIDPKTGGNPFEALIQLSLDENNVGPTITLVHDGLRNTIRKSTDEGTAFFSSIHEVKSGSSAGSARLAQ